MIEDGRILFPKSPSGRPREKKFVKDLQANVTGFSTCLDSKTVGHTTNGTREVTGLIGGKFFDFPKPVNLLRELLIQATDFNDIILDFFSGSATTAHAVMQLNAEDGGNRKFIMVQLPELCDEKSEAFKAGYKTIAEIGKERIRRAGKKIREEITTKHTNDTKNDNQLNLGEADQESFRDFRVFRGSKALDIGFRVLKIDSSNMADVYYTPDDLKQAQLELFTDNIKPDRTPEDLLFQVLLDWGVDLSLPIRKTVITTENTESTESKKQNPSVSSVSSVVKNSFEVFFVDEDALIACFEKNVSEDLVKKLAQFKPLRVVFRDAGFSSDAVKINAEQIFRQMSPATEVKSI
jgi:adenine-specific DNA-methyltransferase